MLIVGLTGSIAMGKTEVAKILARQGVPVFDADAAVHDLYGHGGGAVEEISKLLPLAVVNNSVNRSVLTKELQQNSSLLAKIEKIVHPLVRAMENRFLAAVRVTGAPFVVLDIPLLFETGRQAECDRIVVVSAPPDVQRSRALKRAGMTEQKLDLILTNQVPDKQKRQMAHYIVDTSGSLKDTALQVNRFIDEIRLFRDGANDP